MNPETQFLRDFRQQPEGATHGDTAARFEASAGGNEMETRAVSSSIGRRPTCTLKPSAHGPAAIAALAGDESPSDILAELIHHAP